MRLTKQQLRKLIQESTELETEDNSAYLEKLKSMLTSSPTIEAIRHASELAGSLGINPQQFESIAYPAVTRMIQNANVLESIEVDNVIHELDDVLYRVRDIGLKALGFPSVDSMEDTGQLSEEQVNDNNMELALSVRDSAMVTIERSIAQAIMESLK